MSGFWRPYQAKIDEEKLVVAELNPDNAAEMTELFELLGVTQLGEKTQIKKEIRELRSLDKGQVGQLQELVSRIKQLERRVSISSLPRQYDGNAALDLALGWHLTAKLTNAFASPSRVQEIEMVIDSGMVGVDMDLILPYNSVRGLGLKNTNETTTPEAFGGHRDVELSKFQPVLVEVPLHDPVKKETIVVKSSYLDVWSKIEEDVSLRLGPSTKDGMIHLVPHTRAKGTVMSTALLGKQGLAKLGLRLDPKTHCVFQVVKTSRV